MSYFKGVVKGRLWLAIETRNVYYFDGTTEQDQYIFMDVGTYLDSVYGPLEMYITTLWSSYELEVFKWSGTSWVPFRADSYDVSGINVTDPLPSQVAAVIRGITTGFKTVGRKFFAGFTEEACEAGIWTAGAVVALGAALTAYITRVQGVTGDLVPGSWKKSNNTFYSFLGGTASAIPGTMRRRKVGVGI